jgi:hypothetical protein
MTAQPDSNRGGTERGWALVRRDRSKLHSRFVMTRDATHLSNHDASTAAERTISVTDVCYT